MSFPHYQARVTTTTTTVNNVHQPGPDAPASQPDQQAVQDVPRKGLKDVTVIQTRGMLGPDEETLLTSQYFGPQRNRKKAQRKYDGYALLVRRIIRRTGDGDIPGHTELVIQSEILCTAFREIVHDTYDSIDIKSTPITIPAPFYELFFKRKAIREYSNDLQRPEDLRTEMKHLVEFIGNDKLTIGNQKEYGRLIEQNTIGYETLWTLFPPNELVIRNDGEALECWLCRDVKPCPISRSWCIMGIQLGFDGKEVGLTKSSHIISFLGRVNGTMDISQLPLIPVRYFHKWDNTKKALVKRGEELRRVIGNGHAYRHYSGPLWEDHGLSSRPESMVKSMAPNNIL